MVPDASGNLPTPGRREVLTKFDAMAMVQPKSRADIVALLGEALYQLEIFNEHLDQLGKDCEAAQKRKLLPPPDSAGA